MKTEIFQYNGNPITFQLGNGDVMVSATQMSKPFGNSKRPKNFLAIKSTKDFLAVLSEGKKMPSSELVQVIHGDNGGTFMNEDVALEFARWLSPSFAIWCNSRIKELLKTGVTTITDDDEVIFHAMNVLQKRLDVSKAKTEQLEEQNRLQSEQLQISAPKVEFYDKVLQSESTYSTNKIAKELGMSAVTLNKILRERGVQYKEGGQWLLKAKHQDKGYTKTHTHHFTQTDGELGTRTYTVWTEKGRQWLHELFTPTKIK